MGVFLSKYNMLHSLAEKEDMMTYARTSVALSKFKLFGLIIYDPATHKEFHQKLIDSFELLDYLTGQDFLFISIADINSHDASPQLRRYYLNIEEGNALEPSNTYKSSNSSITAYTLAKTLGIEYD